MREEKRSQPEGLEFVCKVVLQQLVEADLSLTMYVSPPDSIPSSPPPGHYFPVGGGMAGWVVPCTARDHGGLCDRLL